jgi:hypothetical protein
MGFINDNLSAKDYHSKANKDFEALVKQFFFVNIKKVNGDPISIRQSIVNKKTLFEIWT